ncbi:unnamed protein product [Prorocentrum cordatum]|uniref:Uncharacterized protein n=1 Tax=Prorocentrum cordatum TaxID=2364126 RepID=A0ABN9SJX1_9DINO|nr:unnamed protein product [Polarella glacialis]
MWSTENSRVSAGLRGHRWHSADPNANRTLFPISKRSAGSPAPAVSLGRRALACARGGGRALGARRLPEATRRGGRSAGAPRKRHVRCQRSGKEGERERGERNKEGEIERERKRKRERESREGRVIEREGKREREREKAKERERERVRATSLTTAHHGTAGSADRQAPQPWPPCDAARSQRQRAAGRRGSESRRG